MAELKIRTISGIILAAVAVTAIYAGGWLFYLLVLAAGILMAREFDKILGQKYIVLLCVIFPLLLLNQPETSIKIMLLGLAGILFLEKPYWNLLAAFLIYLPCQALVWIRETQGAYWVFWLASTVVATDIAAYFAGKRYGKRKLAPSISPHKTWEGAAGGLAAALGVGVAFGCFAYSGVISILAMLGDLLESKIKRVFGVKDSGNLIPGHGGILDRVDGFILAAPAAALILYWS